MKNNGFGQNKLCKYRDDSVSEIMVQSFLMDLGLIVKNIIGY